MAGEEAAKNGQPQKDGGGDLHAEPEGFLYPIVLIGAVVEAAHRLEALAEADESGVGEHHDPADHGHGGDSRISVGVGRDIQGGGGNASQSLPEEGGQSSTHDLTKPQGGKTHIAKVDGNTFGDAKPHKQQAEADELT